MLLIGCVGQLALRVVAPQATFYSGDLAAKGVANYTLWDVGPQVPAINPAAIAAPEEDDLAPPDEIITLPEESAPVVVIPAPSSEPVLVANQPTATPSPSPSATQAVLVPTFTPTPTRTTLPIATPTPNPATATPSPTPVLGVASSPTVATPIISPASPTVPPSTPVPTTIPPTATSTPPPVQVVSVGFATTNIVASEWDGLFNVEVRVTISPPTGTRGTVSVDYATIAGGTATQGLDYQPTSGTLTFAPTQNTRTFSMTILADSIKEAQETVRLQLSNPSGAILLPGGDTALLTIFDSNDLPLVRFAATAQTVNEGLGTAVSVPLALSHQSDFTVSIPYTISGTAGATDHNLVNGTLSFAPNTTTAAITFNLINDRIAENAENLIITLGTPTNGIRGTPDVYTVTITDNDPPGLTVQNRSATQTGEDGTSITFEVLLDSQPTANVTVPISVSDATEASVSPTNVVFTSANWNNPVVVTVTGLNDFVDDGDIAYTVQVGTTTSADPFYSAAFTRTVNLTNVDDDTAGVNISTTLVHVVEGGATDTYTIVLNSEPLTNVQITLTPDPEVRVNGATTYTLIFTPTTWNTPQTVTVSGYDDWVDEEGDGNVTPHAGLITHTATSTDPLYNAMAIDDVAAEIVDNDTSQIVLVPLTGGVSEAGDVTPVTVGFRLATRPSANVTITATVADGQLLLNGAATQTLTFTNLNWATPQLLTVTAVDDPTCEGLHSGTINFAVASGDPFYAPLTIVPQTVAITDNDPAELIVSALSSPTTSEAGATSTFTVRLRSQPLADVVVPISSSDTSEGSVSPAILTFTAANWSDPQTVTVTGVNDWVDDGDQPYTLTVGPTTSASALYANVTWPGPISLTNLDNDTAGVSLQNTPVAVTEGGATAIYRLVLDSEPLDNVVITVTAASQVQVNGGNTTTLTFTPADWNTAQDVLVSALDDVVDEISPHLGLITHSAASTDPLYNAITIANVAPEITDNDTAGVTFTPLTGPVAEAGDATPVTFSVVLDTQPTEDVTITVSADAQVRVNGAATQTLTFTATDWNNPRTITVTAVDDVTTEGAHTGTISFTMTSADPFYNLTLADLSAAIVDDDPAALDVSALSGTTTSEGGTTVTFEVRLATQPLEDVVVPISSDDTSEATATPATLTFTTGNWNTPQIVTVTGQNDDLDDGDANYSVTLGPTTSASALYAGLSDAVPLTNLDDDTAGVDVQLITPPLQVSEAGISSTYQVVLGSQPTFDVTITVNTDPTNPQVLVNGAATTTLTFTTGNWNAAQTVTVTAINDDVDEDGDNNLSTHPATITHTAASTDPNYNAIVVASVAVNITDNDTAGVTVTAAPMAFTEGLAGSATYTLVLTSQPTDDVVITANAGTQLLVGGAPTQTITFTGLNWNTPQTVTVTVAVDAVDEDGDGNVTPHPGQVTHTAVSIDPRYSGITIAPVDASITDNDDVGLNVNPTIGTTTEAGGTATFSVWLNSQPEVNVTVPITSNDTSEGTVNPAVLTFTPGNWDQVQTITITGVNDALDDGDVAYTVTLGPTSSAVGDAYQSGLSRTINLTNTDNDTAGITLTPLTGAVAEDGEATPVTFSVVLDTQPTDDVVITVNADVQVRVNGAATQTLTFTDVDWATPQVITVTAVDDLVYEGTHTGTISFGVSSADLLYNPLTIPNYTATITDNDTIEITIDDVTAYEGDVGQNFVFTVSLSGAAGGEVRVNYTTADLTATAGSDYTTTSGQLVIPDGDTSATITVPVLGDTLFEPDEAFVVLLSNPTTTGLTPVEIVDNQGIGTLLNDPTDTLVMGFTQANYSVRENAGPALLTVRLSAPAAADFIVTYTTTPGTATAPADYTTPSGSFTFAAGQIEQTMSVTIVNDGLSEPDETFTLTLNPIVGMTLSQATATVAIIDNDRPVLTEAANFLQTAGPTYVGNGWNYYANQEGTSTYIQIDIPCLTTGHPVQIGLYDAAVNAASPDDSVNLPADPTTFWLYQMPNGWSYTDGLLAGTLLTTQTYPQPTPAPVATWENLTTLPAGSCGTFLLRTETSDNDVNGWGMRVVWQGGASALDYDGVAGTGDEIMIGMQQAELRSLAGNNRCTTIYEYVAPGQPSVTFHNYDMDDISMGGWLATRLRYYPPSAVYDPLANTGGFAGTRSGNMSWNNGTATTRGGDTYLNPEPGWWKIVTCTDDLTFENQLIQEGQTDQPSYLTQPGTPDLALTLTPSVTSVARDTPLDVVVAYTNRSSGATAGAALGSTFSVTLPSDLSYVSCSGATCVQTGNTLSVTMADPIAAGSSGSFTITLRSSTTGSGAVALNLSANYTDLLRNPFVRTTGTVLTITP
ncbi:Na-Ca exchanger/integrin-beta4 [Oscillochloris trichoides DG-6]|uniref:Na-Ca exchanger/integrin-beta4 n=1 Tax=Oscillochloris trichoides DG-6 TaxID=765420 RepID=E1IH97_9CHLR|nr:Na-Ca exchanger/integrin-beta4 [Oscillochloris trichoides DG-6]